MTVELWRVIRFILWWFSSTDVSSCDHLLLDGGPHCQAATYFTRLKTNQSTLILIESYFTLSLKTPELCFETSPFLCTRKMGGGPWSRSQHHVQRHNQLQNSLQTGVEKIRVVGQRSSAAVDHSTEPGERLCGAARTQCSVWSSER